MRRFTVAAAVVAAAIILAGCSGTISTSTGGERDQTPIKTWPTAPALTGELPVGYWACIDDFDVEELRTANDRSAPRTHRCRGTSGGSEAIEYRPDGTGYDLEQYRRGQ